MLMGSSYKQKLNSGAKHTILCELMKFNIYSIFGYITHIGSKNIYIPQALSKFIYLIFYLLGEMKE